MKPLIPPVGERAVAWQPEPFAKPVMLQAKDNLSIQQILRCVPGLPDRFWTEGVVFAHAEHAGQGYEVEIKREFWANPHWHCAVPVPDTAEISLTLHLAPGKGRGGDGGQGKSTFALVASIALIAATAAISGGALGALTGAAFLGAGTLGASLAAAGVGILGSLAIAALSPPPTLSGNDDNRGDTLGSASANGNILERAGVIPRVIGTFRCYPSFASPPIVELIGDDEWLEVVYCMNGAHLWEDIRVDNVPIDQIEGIEYETRPGLPTDTPLTLVTRRGYAVTPAQELSRQTVDLVDGSLLKDQTTPANSVPIWHDFTSRTSPDKVWLHVLAPEGLQVGQSPGSEVTVPVRIRVRVKGTSTWINLPEVHFSWSGAQQFKKAIVLRWDTLASIPVPPDGYGPVRAFAVVPTQDVDPVGTGGWTANAGFVGPSGGNVYEAGTQTTTKLRNTALYDDRAEFYLGTSLTGIAGVTTQADPIVQPLHNRLDIQVKRGQPFIEATFASSVYEYGGQILDFFGYYNSFGGAAPAVILILNTTRDRLVILRVETIQNQHPIGGPGLALLAIRVKNTALQRVSALLSGLVPDWSGFGWTGNVVTSNPAPHLRYLWSGALTADPLPTALIDEASLVAWRATCAAAGHQCNMIADGQDIEELGNILTGCGFARVVRSEDWGVFEDKDRTAESPVQIFSPRTMANFRWTKAMPRRPHGLRMRYHDKTKDYEEGEELIVYDEGYTAETATRLEAANYIGLVTDAENQARAEHDLAQSRLRDTFYVGECNAEALVARRGSLVGVQHDTIQHQAGFGRILEKLFTPASSGGLVSGIVLDSKVPCDLGGDFFSIPDLFAVPDIFDLEGSTGAAIRLKDGSGSLLVKEVEADVEETDTLMFATPFADPGDDALGPGCHVVTGPLASEYLRLLVADVRPGPDLTAMLTMVDEAPEVFLSGTRMFDVDGSILVDPDGAYITDIEA